MVNVIRHSSQNRIDDCLLRISSGPLVTMEFLYPLEIDDRHYPHQKINMSGNVCIRPDITAMQTLIEQQVSIGSHIIPRREGSGFLVKL